MRKLTKKQQAESTRKRLETLAMKAAARAASPQPIEHGQPSPREGGRAERKLAAIKLILEL